MGERKGSASRERGSTDDARKAERILAALLHSPGRVKPWRMPWAWVVASVAPSCRARVERARGRGERGRQQRSSGGGDHASASVPTGRDKSKAFA